MKVLFSATCQENRLSDEDREILRESLAKSSRRLFPQEHYPGCPVACGASSDCCWPTEVCVEDDYVPPLPVDLVWEGRKEPKMCTYCGSAPLVADGMCGQCRYTLSGGGA
jgi:hypothetical protein